MSKRAFIAAAGLGTRLRPLTDTMPKALVPYGGIPLLERVIERLKGAGYDEFVINIHHFADQVEEFLSKRGDFGVRIMLSDERDLLRETGGGIRHAAPILADSPSGRFLVHNVDIITDLDLSWFDSLFGDSAEGGEDTGKHIADLFVTERKTARNLLFDSKMHLVGWINTETSELRSPYPGLNPDECIRGAFGGIHNISAGALKLMEGCPERFSIIDFYLDNCRDFVVRGIMAPGVSVTDVGKAQNLITPSGTR